MGCSPSTESSKGTLTGTVSLEGLSDHSDITISLYDLAYLDTTIVRINNEYPHIGVIITQHTEFDHRLQSPVKTTTTLADGSFELEKISTGTYNLVAQKAEFGFRYIYEINISKGDNELSSYTNKKNNVISTGSSEATVMERSQSSSKVPERSDIALFPEVHLSGEVTGDIVVDPDHHLVIDDDTNFGPSTSLTLMPDAVVRINPGKDLKIYGELTAQGEEGHMFWVTSNHGFEDDFKHDILDLYNSMELTPVGTNTDNIILWGKWSWGNSAFRLNQVSSFLSDCLIDNCESGFYFNAMGSAEVKKTVVQECRNESEAGIYFINEIQGNCLNNIILNCYNGVKIKTNSEVAVNNCFIKGGNTGVNVSYYSLLNIQYSEIRTDNYGINSLFSACSIQSNNIYSDKCIKTSRSYDGIFDVSLNNLNCVQYAIVLGKNCYQNDCTNNYYYTINKDDILSFIFDVNDVDPDSAYMYEDVIFEPYLNNFNNLAGINE